MILIKSAYETTHDTTYQIELIGIDHYSTSNANVPYGSTTATYVLLTKAIVTLVGDPPPTPSHPHHPFFVWSFW